MKDIRLRRLFSGASYEAYRGLKFFFSTNASGGINRDFQVGDFMMITDHISSFVPSPLIGENVSELGERFPDMTKIYDANLNQIIEKTAAEEKIILKKRGISSDVRSEF